MTMKAVYFLKITGLFQTWQQWPPNMMGAIFQKWNMQQKVIKIKINNNTFRSGVDETNEWMVLKRLLNIFIDI